MHACARDGVEAIAIRESVDVNTGSVVGALASGQCCGWAAVWVGCRAVETASAHIVDSFNARSGLLREGGSLLRKQNTSHLSSHVWRGAHLDFAGDAGCSTRCWRMSRATEPRWRRSQPPAKPRSPRQHGNRLLGAFFPLLHTEEC